MKMTEAMKLVAQAQGCDVRTLREAMKQHVIPYGTAFQSEGSKTKYTYLLFPMKVKEYLGLDLGDKPFMS